MKKITICFLALIFIMSLSFAAFANTPRINRREREQQKRIAQGIESGQLTAREAARLERQEAGIRRYERHAKSDGHLSYRERDHLEDRLDRESRQIYRQKHDGQHQ